ncbi:YlmC/YmxH family sporulation protein [Schinkia sp. CFF1]
MRLSEMNDKEIIDLKKGERLGVLGQADLEIDETSGHVKAFLIPTMKWFGFKKEGTEVRVPWQNVKKIGSDMIIIDFNE